MSKYMIGKEKTRELAMGYFDNFLVVSWGELQEMTDRLERRARRFGLLREFRENGIL